MSKKEIREEAVQLEALLPRLMRLLSPAPEEDPLAQLPLGQLRLMRALKAGPRCAGDVADELGLSPSAMSQLAQRLVEAGMIEKEDDPDDRRSKMLFLTGLGTELISARYEIRVGRAEKLLSRLSPQAREALLEGLTELVTGDRHPERLVTAAIIEKGYSL